MNILETDPNHGANKPEINRLIWPSSVLVLSFARCGVSSLEFNSSGSQLRRKNMFPFGSLSVLTCFVNMNDAHQQLTWIFLTTSHQNLSPSLSLHHISLPFSACHQLGLNPGRTFALPKGVERPALSIDHLSTASSTLHQLRCASPALVNIWGKTNSKWDQCKTWYGTIAGYQREIVG